MTLSLRTRAAGLVAAHWAVALLVASCTTPAAVEPRAGMPLSEERAKQVIAAAIAESALTPSASSQVEVPYDRQLEVDVSVANHSLGIAYVTEQERHTLGKSVPAQDIGRHALQLIRGVENPRVTVLLLHDRSYLEGGEQNSEYERSSHIAERKLRRDVKDFLAKAKREGW